MRPHLSRINTQIPRCLHAAALVLAATSLPATPSGSLRAFTT
jgi:hypothetical protein